MIYDFPLPDIGEGLVDGEVVKWHVAEGDAVKESQPLVTVLTDKAEVEIPSPKTGTVVKLLAKPGEKVKVHAPLVTFELAGAAAPESGTGEATSAAPAAAVEAAAAGPGPVPGGGETPARPVSALPAVRKLASDLKVDLTRIAGTGPDGRITEEDVRKAAGKAYSPSAVPGAEYAPGAAGAAKQPAQPVFVASDLTTPENLVSLVHPESAAASAQKILHGPFAQRAEGAPAETAGDAGGAGTAAVPGAPIAPGTAAAENALAAEERVPFVGIRRRTAEKMALSARTVAAVTHVDEADFTGLVILRIELKSEAERRGVKLTYLPFILKALAKALAQFPNLNATLDEQGGAIVRKRACNIGIATAAEQGLVVPVVRDVEKKDLWTIAADVNRLAEKARANRVEMSELQGGTFTVTNIGPIGGLFATPIVNHPEVGILGVMKIQKRPVVKDGGIHVRDMAYLALTFDHRVLDGAEAAEFMNTLIKHLENPRTLL